MSISILDEKQNIIYSNSPEEDNKPKTVRVSKSKVSVHNPIFLSMAECTTDCFWTAKLECWANARYGRKFKYKNGSITYTTNNVKRVIYEEKLHEDDMEENLRIFKAFIGKHEKIMSDNDCVKNDELAREFHNTEEYKKKCGWQSIMTNISHRNSLFQKFVISKTRQQDLTSAQAVQLMDCLKLKILCGDCNGTVFKYADDEIVSVDGIVFEGEGADGKFVCLPKKTKTRRGMADEGSETNSMTSISSSLGTANQLVTYMKSWNDLKKASREKYKSDRGNPETTLRSKALASIPVQPKDVGSMIKSTVSFNMPDNKSCTIKEPPVPPSYEDIDLNFEI